MGMDLLKTVHVFHIIVPLSLRSENIQTWPGNLEQLYFVSQFVMVRGIVCVLC